jgi:hypothetical protein
MKLRLFFTTLSISFFIANITNAQTDSTHYDLGRIMVKKDFTQSITVKAADIERYQFSNISDALKVFFSGTFTNAGTNSTSVTYVVDGNIVDDVNNYSIQDVEEITLVQSALGQVSGAAPSQQMILIKTRRGGAGKQGITIADQTSFVDARNNENIKDPTKTTGIYEQAYAGAYKNFTNADLGFSVDYLHDVYPDVAPNTYSFADPFHFSRLKLNGYTDTRLWKGTSLHFGINYSPQVTNEAYLLNENTNSYDLDYAEKYHMSQHIFNTNVALNSHIAAGLTNTLSAGYNHYHFNEDDMGDSFFTEPGEGYSQATYSTLNAYQQATILLLKDNLVYHKAIGNWNIDPSLNFMYRHVTDTLSLKEQTFEDSVSTPYAGSVSGSKGTFKLSLLTPSLNIYYKNILDIQGGFVAILNKEDIGSNYPVQRMLPFVSASLNISEAAKLQAVKLSIYGSFSRQNDFLNDPYVTLSGFTLLGFAGANIPQYSSIPISYSPYNTYQTYNNYQGGFVFGLGRNFTLDYNFRKNYYATLAVFLIPIDANETGQEDLYEKVSAITNRAGISYTIHSGIFTWVTGLNTTESKLQLANAAISPSLNQYLSTGHRWTGGFTNRFTYKNLFAGLDILYQVGQRPYSLEGWQTEDADYIAPLRWQ